MSNNMGQTHSMPNPSSWAKFSPNKSPEKKAMKNSGSESYCTESTPFIIYINEMGDQTPRCGGPLFHVVDYCTIFFLSKKWVGFCVVSQLTKGSNDLFFLNATIHFEIHNSKVQKLKSINFCQVEFLVLISNYPNTSVLILV